MVNEENNNLSSINDTLVSLTAGVGRLNNSIKKYSINSDKFSKRLYYLNIVLTFATVIGAIATFLVFLRGG